MLATLDVKLNDTGFKIALALIGAGAGLLASQLGNVIMSSVAPDEDQRGGRAPGHRPEPRVLARHGDHRRGAARVARDGLQPSASPTTPTSRRPRARRSSRTPSRGSTSCPSTTSSRRRSRAGSRQDQAQRRRRGLRRRAARRAAAGARRRRARGAAVAVVHAATADRIARGGDRGRYRGAGGNRLSAQLVRNVRSTTLRDSP